MTHKKNDPIAGLRASLPAELTEEYDTIGRLRAKFIRTRRDDDLAREMNLLINEAIQPRDPTLPPSLDNRSPARGLALIGPTGVGKTTSLRKLFEKHPAFQNYRDAASDSVLLWFSAPSPCTKIQFGRAFLRASGYPIERDLPAHRLFEMVSARLNEMGKIVVCIEEFQHVVHNVSPRDQQAVADILKDLMEVQRITLIISGIQTLKPFLALDPQLDRRMTKIFFDKMEPTDLDQLTDIMHAYAEEAGLKVAYSDSDALVPRLSHASLNALGIAIETIISAIALCKQKGDDTLVREHFATRYAAKSGKPMSENPFLAERWFELVCTTEAPDTDPDGPEPATKRGNKKKK